MSTRTSRADRNYLGLGANGAVDFFAGTPDARPGVLPEPFVVIPPVPQDWDATIKAGGGVGNGWTIPDGKAAQGRENVVDCNHVHDNSFKLAYGVDGGIGDQVLTVKGGSYNITFAGTIYSFGRNADCVIGMWSDQNFDISHDLDFSSLRRGDSRPITFIFGRVGNPLMAALGRPPTIKLPPNAKVLFWKSIGVVCYWWLKFAAVKLGIL